jgi:hypothetical protein
VDAHNGPLGGVLAGGQGGPGALGADVDRVLLQHAVLQAQVQALPALRQRDCGDGRATAALLLPPVQQQGGREGRAPVGVHWEPCGCACRAAGVT